MQFDDIVKSIIEEKRKIKSVKQLAKKHKVSKSAIKKELKKGKKVEKEHTDKTKKAKNIAKQHLDEDPKYYSKLKKIGL